MTHLNAAFRIALLLWLSCLGLPTLAKAQDIPRTGLQLWLRADSVAWNPRTARIGRAFDLSGQGRDAIEVEVGSGPQFLSLSSAFGNRQAMFYDASGPTAGSASLGFRRIENIRTVFIVARSADTTSLQFMLGDSTAVDFHGGGSGQGGGTLFVEQFTSPSILEGNLFYNGVAQNPRTAHRPRVPTIITVQTTGNVRASTLSADRPPLGRATANRSWRGEIAEALIYSVSLTEEQRRAVERYLAQRYAIDLPPQAMRLAFIGAPTSGRQNVALPAFSVEARLANGARDSLFTSNITLSLSGAGALSGTLTRPAVLGRATFNDIRINAAGTFRLVARSGTLAADSTAPFSVLNVERDASRGIPADFALEQNYPNPFNPSTVIAYQLPTAQQVSLKVYDMLGRQVATLVNARQAAGSYRATFNAAQLSSGIYFYRLQAGAFAETKKMMLVK